jgi:hypothetical protein
MTITQQTATDVVNGWLDTGQNRDQAETYLLDTCLEFDDCDRSDMQDVLRDFLEDNFLLSFDEYLTELMERVMCSADLASIVNDLIPLED